MSHRVAYLQRSAGGAAVTRVRLVDRKTEWGWPSAGARPGEPREGAIAAARWTYAQTSGGGGATTSLLVCLDLDGAACGWLTAG